MKYDPSPRHPLQKVEPGLRTGWLVLRGKTGLEARFHLNAIS